jgi:hypothetical protein
VRWVSMLQLLFPFLSFLEGALSGVFICQHSRQRNANARNNNNKQMPFHFSPLNRRDNESRLGLHHVRLYLALSSYSAFFCPQNGCRAPLTLNRYRNRSRSFRLLGFIITTR